ncbi:MAG: hypothetical protein A2Z30_07050 [Chloroflexi bacterium RBG_16_64_43]|nr:MAG: hypothetical protein A2Z30_07050 [Chloroflexi bacterium RBG_16_64_43]
MIVPSRWLASLFEGARFPAREVRLIPNGVDARLFEPGDKDSARREAALSTDRKIVLVVGNYLRTNPWKNFDTALAVARRLGESDSPAGIDLVCAGESGETMHIGTVRVLFMGRNLSRAAMANLYRASDVFLHPSRADTFPISVLEAMSAGLPIVASCVGGVPEQVVEGQTGFLLRPGDSAGMAAAVHSLLSDAAKAERLGAAGRARVLEFFRFEVQVEATIDFLREVAARRPHDQRHEAGESTASLAPDARS